MNEDRLRVWAARLAAPVAFFFAAIVLVLLVQNGLGAGTTTDTRRTTPAPAPAGRDATATDTGGGGRTATSSQRPGRRIYRVQAGDTLWSIALANYAGDPREGVWKLQARNHLAGTTISPGERLTLP